MYSVVFSDLAFKQLKKLNKSSQKRIILVIERTMIRPGDYVKKLVGMQCYRLRVGDYRVILDIRIDKKEIFVMKTGHRRGIYKNL